MTPDRWQQIECLYHEALERATGARTAFLAEACQGDDGLRREVAALLKYDDRAANFIETPALEVAAKQLAAEALSSQSSSPVVRGAVTARMTEVKPVAPPHWLGPELKWLRWVVGTVATLVVLIALGVAWVYLRQPPRETASPAPAAAGTRLTWFDRSGTRLGTVGEAAAYSGPAVSPDEKRLVVAASDPKTKTRDLWIIDLSSGAGSRLTFDPADDLNPVWSPDGQWIYFTSTRKGTRNIYRKLADGAGEVERVLESDGDKAVEDVSSDGKFLFYNLHPPLGGEPDLYFLSLAGAPKPVTFLATESREVEAQVSPDGRWVAYRSFELGGSHIFVRRFMPDGSKSEQKWQVSSDGGLQPRWRADGKELFYLDGNTLMAVEVNTDGPTFSAGTPKPLFKVKLPAEERRNRFVVTKDGQRFLVISTEATGKSP